MSSLVLSEVFEGHPLTFVMLDGAPVLAARELGAAMGYADPLKLGEKIRGAWAEEFIEGEDYRTIRGPDLGRFRELSPGSGDSSIDPRTPSILVLTESGVWTAAQKTGQRVGVNLRRFLTRHVLPKLARGEAIAPAGPAPAAVDADPALALMNEAVRQTIAAREYARNIGDTKGEAFINRQIPRVCLGFIPKQASARIPRAPTGQLALPVAVERDPVDEAWIALVTSWAASGQPSAERKAGEIMAYAPSEILDTIRGNDARGRGMSFGHMLSQRNDQAFGPWRIKKRGNGYTLAKAR